MSKKKDRLLLIKTSSVSFFIHLVGISLFSLVLPFPRIERRPIEVSILPPSTVVRPEIKLVKAKTIPEVNIPRVIAKDEKIATLREPEIIKLSTEQFTGSQQYIPVTQITDRLEIPEFQVKLPDIISFKSLEKGMGKKIPGINIEGPAGSRVLLYREQADYPDWAQEKGIEGNVQIKFWVDPDGKIELTSLIASSGFPELDIYAEQSLRKWLFEPVQTDKKAWGIITFIFRLK
jgi:TonB family protein